MPAPLSPRRRGLRIATAVLVAIATIASVIGALAYRKTRPKAYRPDEHSADITSSLARHLPREAPKPKFNDVTVMAGLSAFRNFTGSRSSQLPEDMGPGLAWGDFNNDGNEDLFLVSAGGPLGTPQKRLEPCVLFQNLGNGTFRRVESFPDLRIHGMGAAWGDYDADGFLDLVVTGYGTLQLFHNDGGTGKFTRDARLPDRKGFWSGAAWGDYDNDHALDLYVCGYVDYIENPNETRSSEQVGTTVPYTLNPASYPAATNLLFHNNSNETFTEVAGELRVQNPTGRSLGALWHDFDEDGWLDLYVANDISDNVLYHNIGGHFEDISHPALVADYRSAMGLAAGDFDRDGDDDLYITHWVAQENALYENTWANFNRRREGPSPSAIPSNNSSAQTNFPLRFMDVADMKGVGQMALPFVGWGTEFVDFDGDGWLDLVVANGNTLEYEGPGPKKLKPQELFLLWNEHGAFFYNLASISPVLSQQHSSRGLAVADFDNDGAMDIAVAQLGESVQLLRNEMQTGHWAKFHLRSKNRKGVSNAFADGTKVIAHLNDTVLRRTISSASYLSQSTRVVHFGLGKATNIARLEVRWHAGPTNFFDNLAADAMYELVEGGNPRRVSRIQPLPTSKTGAMLSREQIVAFWNLQRAGMNAMKIDNDPAKAIDLFRRALEIDPRHEDSRYYLALCLAAQSEVDGALAELHLLQQINPQSHRAFQQWGTLRALSARSDADFANAESSLERAHAINPEETGALLVLGEVSLLRGNTKQAEQRLAAACATNPRALGGFFLRGYIAYANSDLNSATQRLSEARAVLGKDWQPKGASLEGDVKRKQHTHVTPLSGFWENWNGVADPANAFAPLAARLKK